MLLTTVEAADHHLDLPDAQVEEEEVVVVAEPVSLTNIENATKCSCIP